MKELKRYKIKLRIKSCFELDGVSKEDKGRYYGTTRLYNS